MLIGLESVVMNSRFSHRNFVAAKAAALALLMAVSGASASVSEPLGSAEREQATNDLRVLVETARTAWAYAEDKEEHFDVNLPRLLQQGNAAIATCRTRREVLELFDEIVAGLKDGHATLNHPELYERGVRRNLPGRLVDTKEGVVLGKDLVISWNGRAMDEEIRLASRRVYASTPGQRRSLALKSLESGVADSSVRLTLKHPDGVITETNLTYGYALSTAEVEKIFRSSRSASIVP